MIDAGIDDGDLVLIRKQLEAKEGQIVVTLVENENTLKCFYKDKENISTLRSVDRYLR